MKLLLSLKDQGEIIFTEQYPITGAMPSESNRFASATEGD